jgi:hypothetical protein
MPKNKETTTWSFNVPIRMNLGTNFVHPPIYFCCKPMFQLYPAYPASNYKIERSINPQIKYKVQQDMRNLELLSKGR